MTLIRSISGFRGTIGGKQDESLTPPDVVKFASAFYSFLKKSAGTGRMRIIVGRDARISGKMVSDLIVATLTGCGADVTDIGLTTTPTVEMAVLFTGANGGIIITASHNPKEWNALKFLNAKGEFLSAADGAELLDIAGKGETVYAGISDLGTCVTDDTFIDRHIAAILDLPLVDSDAIKKANFSVVVDAVNSTGGLAVPKLLKALGVRNVNELYCTPDGNFPHNP